VPADPPPPPAAPGLTGEDPDAGTGAVALRLESVVRRFGTVTALDHFTLRVARGEVVGLLGHNGAGKTTTVRLLAGLLAPDEGSVAVHGIDPLVDGAGVRQRLGVLPARPVVDDRLTGVQNLAFAGAVFGLDDALVAERSAGLLATFGLTDRAGERVGGYSTGMRQRLSLARVLVSDPDVLLLDEPTAALDPVAARQVRRILATLAREAERTVVVCTHDLAEAEALCDRVVVMAQGRTIAEGSPAELAAAHAPGGLHLEVSRGSTDPAAALLRDPAAAHALGDARADVEVVEPGRLRVDGVARDAVPALIRLLVESGVDLFEARRETPTLEQVYLALHGEVPDEEERP